MSPIRQHLLSAGITLVLACSTHLSGQAAQERTAIGVTVLSAWGKVKGMPDNKFTTLFLEPGVLRGRWTKAGALHDSSLARVRDSTETATYSSSLGVKVLTPQIMEWCSGRSPSGSKNCTSALKNNVIVSMSDPYITNDSATVLLRTGGGVGNNDILGSRISLLYLAKLVRRDGRWTMHCAAMIGGDGVRRPSDVEKSCKPGKQDNGG